MEHLRIGEILVRNGVLRNEQLSFCLAQQRRAALDGLSARLGEILVRNGFATHAQVEAAAAEQNGGHSISHPELPQHLLRRLGVQILGIHGSTVRVASLLPLSDADRQEILGAVRRHGHDVQEAVTEARDKLEIHTHLARIREVDPEILIRHIEKLNQDTNNGQTLTLVQQELFMEALQHRASDIHLDRTEDPLTCWVSYRIDGRLQYRHLLRKEAMAALCTRIKGEAGLDISQMRLAQDGRISLRYQEREIDVRVSTLPTDNGETLTLRLLDPAALKPVSELLDGFPAIMRHLDPLIGITRKMGGLILVAGPTGSGKTTTLYAMLRAMQRERLNIMTAEDPVEYRISAVRQTQVNVTAGLTFPAILRAQLRQDPDVMMVGEIRDGETAEHVLRSAESGHFVLSTLHTNDVTQTISKLAGMIPADFRAAGNFVLANHLKAVINQTLAPRLCDCALPSQPMNLVLHACSLPAGAHLRQRRPSGCEHCNGTGYHGRVMVPEAVFFPASSTLRHEMERLFLGQGETMSGLLNLHGVSYFPRCQSVVALLAAGRIDLETALELLDMRPDQAQEAA